LIFVLTSFQNISALIVDATCRVNHWYHLSGDSFNYDWKTYTICYRIIRGHPTKSIF